MTNAKIIKTLSTISELINEDLIGYEEELEQLDNIIKELRLKTTETPSNSCRYFSSSEEIEPDHIKIDLHKIDSTTLLSKYIHFSQRGPKDQIFRQVHVFFKKEKDDIFDDITRLNDNLNEISFEEYNNIYSTLVL